MKYPTEKQRIGRLGESVAARFLVKHGYRVLHRNYLKRTGEIDIIAEKDNKLYFVEVKTVSRENNNPQSFRPEDNIHEKKLIRLERTIQTYLMEYEEERDWEIIGVMIDIDQLNKTAHIRILDDFAW